MPVGQSTETQQVEAVSKDITLDITMDDFAEQRVGLIRQLAARYGVEPSLVALEVLPGSVQVRMTIATTNGANSAANITTLVQTIAAVSDAQLAASISATFNATNNVTSTRPVHGTVQIEVPFSCPRGKWCTAGAVVNCAQHVQPARKSGLCHCLHPVPVQFDHTARGVDNARGLHLRP
jgi:hypothetical protein